MEKKTDDQFLPMSMSPPNSGRNGTKLRICKYKFVSVRFNINRRVIILRGYTYIIHVLKSIYGTLQISQ